MKKLFFSLLLILGAGAFFTSCKDRSGDGYQTVVDLALANDNLSILASALERADLLTTLNGDGPFTVFAPTNDAFAALLTQLGVSSLNDIPVDQLRAILLNHVVSGNRRSGDLATGYYSTLSPGLNSSNLSVYVDKSAGVKINGTANVTAADVTANNGVVHVIDKVLTLPTIVNQALNNPNFSTLVAALTRPDLGVDYVAILSGNTPYTVFAPTNAAFQALLQQLGASSLNDIPAATLNAVLQNHVVSGQQRSSELVTGYVSTLSTGPDNSKISLFVNLANNAVKVNDAGVAVADVMATNGVVHAIDKVMLPANVVNHALNNPNFSTLVAALTRADLGVDYVSILSGTGPFTGFAPTNAAFTALLTELGVSSLNDIPAATLNAVLQYHVVAGANVRSTQLTEGQQVTSFQGGKFTVTLNDGPKIKDAKDRIANIIATDVQGSNGVVHAIDKVILP